MMVARVMSVVAVLALAQAGQHPIFRFSTDAVLVDVSVRQGGRPVVGLTSADFELLDSGVPQTIASSSLEAVPLDLTLLIDASRSTEGVFLDRLKQAVLDTIGLLRSDDRVRVLAVQHVLEEIVPLQPASDPIPIHRLTARGGTALYDGLAAVMMRPSATGRRQLVVAYTDGDDASSITSPAAMADIALHADAVVHVVVAVESSRRRSGAAAPAPRGGGDVASQALARAASLDAATAAGAAFPGEATLQTIAERTGGRVFVIDLDDSISAAFKDVLGEYRRSYLLQYMPQGVPREGWHEIEVRVKRPGTYEVRARKGWGG